MAFTLFSKPVAKSKSVDVPRPAPAPPHPGGAGGALAPAGAPSPKGAAELAHGFKTTQRLSLADDWNPRHSRIEVNDSAPGLTAVLENAALLFANGQTQGARAALEDGLANDRETQRAVLAWLAQFDLLQRLGERAGFEQLALQYVVAFERSAPTWEEHRPAAAGISAAPATQARMVALTGELSARSEPNIRGLVQASREASPVRLDVTGVSGVDDDGARMLTTTLCEVRRRGVVLQWHGLDTLRALLDNLIHTGDAVHEGAWLLLLEVMQWQADQTAFEERAVEYAITFELSPPSWESLGVVQQELAADPAPEEGGDEANDLFAVQGVMSGPADPQIGKLYDFGAGRDQVLVDMTGVDRIDFVCAGSLYNAIQQLARQDCMVHVAGASAIIRSLLLLIGIPPRHFAKRPQ